MTPFGTSLWISDGPEVGVAGFNYPTRMAAIRLDTGGLWIWSPIQLSQDLREKVNTLGPVEHVVAPNSLHHLALDDWQSAYPEAKFHAAPKLATKRSDIAFSSTLTDKAPSHWANQIEQVTVGGNLITTEVVFFHNASRTVIFTDLIQHFPKGFHTGWRATVAKLDLMVSPAPTVPRKFRAAFTNRTSARTALATIKSWPAEQLMMAHGPLVDRDAKDVLARAFDWL